MAVAKQIVGASYFSNMSQHASKKMLNSGMQLLVQRSQSNNAAAINWQRIESVPYLGGRCSRIAEPKQSSHGSYQHPRMQLKFLGKTSSRRF